MLNNDTIVLPGAIDRAVREMAADHTIGAVGITLLNPDRSLQATYMPYPSLRREFLIFTTLGRRLYGPLYPSKPRDPEPRDVDWMSGAFLLLRRDAYAQVGWMDEAYFMYGEECDLQYRMRRAGWRMVYVPDAEIVHFWGKSSRPYQRRKWIHQGTLRFYALHYGPLRNVTLRAMLALISGVKLFIWLLLCNLPRWRERGRQELASNRAIAALYLQARPTAAHSRTT
jgi:GT2 family glycosyltransferase